MNVTDTTFPVALTASAIAQVKRLLAKDGRADAVLRLGVKGGGCSGLEYVMQIETRRLPHDLVGEFDGVVVVVDAKSALYLQGSSFDYTGSLLGGGFRFENPNVARSCGCGTSFTPR